MHSLMAIVVVGTSVLLCIGFVVLSWYVLALRDAMAHIDGLHRGLRRDFEAVLQTLGSDATDTEKRLTTAHNLAIRAVDRLAYYSKHSAIMQRLGTKYDKEIAKLQAANEAPKPTVGAVPADDAEQDTAPEGMAQVVGAIGG